MLKMSTVNVPAIRNLLRRPSEYATLFIDEFKPYAPYSAGSRTDRARATIAAIDQTFPMLTALIDKTGRSPLAAISISEFADGASESGSTAALKQLLDHYGSDKARDHDYHRLYANLFEDRQAVRSVVEIGLGTNHDDVISTMGPLGRPGASIRAFRDYFPNSLVFGADIDERILFVEERIRTAQVDQTDPSSLDRLGQLVGTDIDLVIDDGLHTPNANIAALGFGLSRIRVGGWVVIEDISLAAQSMWPVVAALLPARFNPTLVTAREGSLFAVRRIS